ncbi:putative leader peptide [Streptomyces incanus]
MSRTTFPPSELCGQGRPRRLRPRPPPSLIMRRRCLHIGRSWTVSRSPCHASVMPGTGIALVSRRHVDLGRMSSAICPAR